MKYAIALLFVLSLVGCAKHPPESVPSLGDVGTGIAGVQTALTVADRSIDLAIPAAKPVPVAQAHMQGAKTAIGVAVEKSAEASVALERSASEASAASKRLADQQDLYAALEARWYVRLGRWAERAFWAIVIYFVVMWGMRIAALFVKGPIGAGMAVASNVMNPTGWVNWGADNAWFRKFGKTSNEQPLIPT